MTLKSSPKTVREKRRAAREAQRRSRRILIGGGVLILLVIAGFFAINGYINKNKTATGTGGSGDAAPAPNIDIVTTDSGLRYQDLVVGTGAEAKAGDTVSVHYTGWLTDGTKFDSSVDRGTPFEFTLGRRSVIAGWDEGVAGMKVGGKRKLLIPADLAYGASGGGGGVIPPNADLVFDVELLGIK